jgi:hypothetical protein
MQIIRGEDSFSHHIGVAIELLVSDVAVEEVAFQSREFEFV